ncbi:hypothetical protein BLNAU_19954 [Blattamonas nauphoetae]|uniref:Uncharacterized protein n=1 Tax=Blattamonas nauphoetae TaxID=2049346 RepID=A0ABQ9X065_9EUKA|nr:hypothetical protein BLNAU_19954 [Blattamonas nauphoetae]
MSSAKRYNDLHAFINWDPKSDMTNEEMSHIFLSLVEMVKTGCQFDEPLSEKAKLYLKTITPHSEEKFVEAFRILFSSQNADILKTALKFVEDVILSTTPSVLLQLIQADLVTLVVTTLNS